MIKLKLYLKEHVNECIGAIVTVALVFLVSILGDYYYDMNDDVLIHDIISGAYTGWPEGHNIQMLYPLGLILTLPYHLTRSVNWYGLFLCICQFGCFYLVINRIISFVCGKTNKLRTGIASIFVFMAFYLYRFAIVQYTVVAGLLIATGGFLIYTTYNEKSYKDFWKKNILSIILIVVGYCMREEMGLLLFPIIAFMGFAKWLNEEKIFTKENVKKYIGTFIIIIVSMIVVTILHLVAYSSDEWSKFNEFFAARTNLYDYGSIPNYEENIDFYEGINITREQHELLLKYNFGLDKEIDAEAVSQIYNKSIELYEQNNDFTSRIKKAVIDYKWRLTNFEAKSYEQTDYPYNLIVIIGYVGVVVLAFISKKYRYLFLALCLFGVRSGLWLFLIYRLRTPSRITMPLYLIEMCVLVAFIITIMREGKKTTKVTGGIIVIALTIASIANLPYISSELTGTILQKEMNNSEDRLIKEYVANHPDNFYFIDVYTSVPFSEKIFEKRENNVANYAIISSWAAKSPIEREKLLNYGIGEVGSAIVGLENVYIINKVDNSYDWLVNSYKSRGMKIIIEEVDMLGDNELEVLKCYSIK